MGFLLARLEKGGPARRRSSNERTACSLRAARGPRGQRNEIHGGCRDRSRDEYTQRPKSDTVLDDTRMRLLAGWLASEWVGHGRALYGWARTGSAAANAGQTGSENCSQLEFWACGYLEDRGTNCAARGMNRAVGMNVAVRSRDYEQLDHSWAMVNIMGLCFRRRNHGPSFYSRCILALCSHEPMTTLCSGAPTPRRRRSPQDPSSGPAPSRSHRRAVPRSLSSAVDSGHTRNAPVCRSPRVACDENRFRLAPSRRGTERTRGLLSRRHHTAAERNQILGAVRRHNNKCTTTDNLRCYHWAAGRPTAMKFFYSVFGECYSSYNVVGLLYYCLLFTITKTILQSTMAAS